jgi:hypothetical protein
MGHWVDVALSWAWNVFILWIVLSFPVVVIVLLSEDKNGIPPAWVRVLARMYGRKFPSNPA